MTIVRAAVVQDAPVAFDANATIDKVESLVAKAAAQGVELVLFPEAFVNIDASDGLGCPPAVFQCEVHVSRSFKKAVTPPRRIECSRRLSRLRLK